jgi:hypothetical protein
MKDPTIEWVTSSDKHSVETLRIERAAHGFSVYDYWNFDQYLAWIIWQACERFKDGNGYPAELDSPEAWIEILCKIQAGMEAHREIDDINSWTNKEHYDTLVVTRDEGLELFSRWMPSFWD